jgi:hypothetical protein
MTGPPDKFQVVKQHNASFSQNLRAITAHQHFNVGTLVVAFLCFRKGYSLPLTLGSSFMAWIAAATVHQFLLK